MTDQVVATPPVTPPAATPPAAPPSWFSTADPTIVGHLQTKGWDKLTPDQAALKAAESHFQFEKMFGVPKEQLLRLPKDAADEAGWKDVYGRLGVPAKPEEYNLTNIKQPDGSPVDAKFTDEVRNLAHKLNLPNNQAILFAQELIQRADTEAKNEQAAYEANLAKEHATLKTNWGNNAPANKVLAQNTAQKFGVSAEEISALEKTIGYARVMEMFRSIGQKTGEDQFIRSEAPGTDGIMTREQAHSKLAVLTNDSAWVQRLTSGDANAKREFDNLTQIAAGVS